MATILRKSSGIKKASIVPDIKVMIEAKLIIDPKKSTITKTAAQKRKKVGSYASITPAVVATALPPLKFKKIE